MGDILRIAAALTDHQRATKALPLVRDLITHLVDHGQIELGTAQSAQLIKAYHFLSGTPVPDAVENSAAGLVVL